MSVMLKIDRYLRATGLPPTKFGRLAVNDPRLVGDLRRGRQAGPTLVAKVEAYIAQNQTGKQKGNGAAHRTGHGT